MTSYTKRSTSGVVLVAMVHFLVSSNAVSARSGNARLLKQVTQPSQRTSDAVNRQTAVSFAPVSEVAAVPALEVAPRVPRAEQVGPLVRGPAGEQVSASQALFSAIRARNVARVRSLLAAGADTDVYSSDGTTPLIEAIAANEGGIFTAILDKGVNTNLPDLQNGNTPLSYAVRLGNLNWATRLLDAGADINLANAEGDTPLFVALKQKPINLNMVRLLLSRTPSATTSAADLTLTDAQGMTAQQVAQASGNRQVIALFQNLPPAGEALPVIPAIATTAGRATAPVLVLPPVSEIVGFAPTAEAGAFPIVSEIGGAAPTAETLATTLLP